MNNQNGADLEKQNARLETLKKKRRTRDIVTPSLNIPNLKWTTHAETQESIGVLYQYVEANAQASIEWYARSKNLKAWMSQGLRFLAIMLTTLGGLTPILSALDLSSVNLPQGLGRLNLGQLGYLLLGLAAACIGFDRYFGFSSGWMRYIATMMALERSLSEFRLDWAMMIAKLGEKPPTPDQTQLMIQRLKEFLITVDGQVEQETLTWVSEFKTNLSEIEKTAKSQAEATRPGAIAITVTNGMETEDGFTLAMDGMEVKKVRGTKYQIGYVPPGPHKIAVAGTINGEPLDASELVNVTPGEIASVTIALPVKEAQP